MKESEIRKLIKLVEEAEIDEIEISHWWKKIRISKTKYPGNSHNAVYPVIQEAPAQQPKPAPEKVEEELSSDMIEIKSPMVGTYYRAPAPDAKPYVEENQYITPGQVLCIIEAMKLMNEIESEVSGKIVKILVENAQPVEYGQALFLVDPNA